MPAMPTMPTMHPLLPLMFAPLRRPACCLRTLYRPTGHQRQLQVQHYRGQAKKPAEVLHNSKIPGLFKYRRNHVVFAVHPAVPSIRATEPAPLPAFHRTQIARMDPTGARTALFSKSRLDCAREGDILLVTPRRGEPFAGVLMQIRRRGVDTAIQLRGQLMRTGVEMWYKIYSPEVVGIDVVWRRPKRARRARLTYLRKPKHDMGDVEKYVMTWKREQRALRSRGRGGGEQRGRGAGAGAAGAQKGKRF